MMKRATAPPSKMGTTRKPVPDEAPPAVKKAAKSKPVSIGKDALVEHDDVEPPTTFTAKVASKFKTKKAAASSSSKAASPPPLQANEVEPPRPPVAPDLVNDVDFNPPQPQMSMNRRVADDRRQQPQAGYFASSAAPSPPLPRKTDADPNAGYMGDTQSSMFPSRRATASRAPQRVVELAKKVTSKFRRPSVTEAEAPVEGRDVTAQLQPAYRQNLPEPQRVGKSRSLSASSLDSTASIDSVTSADAPRRKLKMGNAWTNNAVPQQDPVRLQQQQRQRTTAPLPAPMPQTPITAGRFRIDYSKELGSGGFGVVYKAFDTQEGDFVAVKETHVGREDMRALEASMKSEFAILTRLDHPNVVRVLHFAAEDGRSRIFMEWMPMGSVHGILRGTGFRLHERVVRRYSYEALLGLSYLHARSILHRDIKPANMLVSGTATVKISDFGTSKEIMATTVQSTQNVVGTPCYLSAEAITEGRYSTGSDVWALACAIIEMATGQPPWAELPRMKRQPVPLMFHIGSASPPNHHPAIPAHLSADLREILQLCFAADPTDRPSVDTLLATPYFRGAETRQALPDTAEPVEAYDALLMETAAAMPEDARSLQMQTLTVVNSFGGNTTMSTGTRTGSSSVYSAMAMPVTSDP